MKSIIYGRPTAEHRSMINRFLESAQAELPESVKVIVTYRNYRKRHVRGEITGWEICPIGSKRILCKVDTFANSVTWYGYRRRIKKFVNLTDYIGIYTREELLPLQEAE